jgi:hypothetical protein
MAKRKYAINENTISRRLAEGRGHGNGQSYKPWIYVHEVPSIGKSSIRKGWKSGREHHLLSQLEKQYFYMLEWDDSIIDIREQFPLLPREETQQIACELGVKHPRDPHTGVDVVMSTDALGTVKKQHGETLIARSVKYEIDLRKARTIEKQLIEKEYWRRRKVEWKVFTEDSIQISLVRNIELVHKSFHLYGLFPGIDEFTLCAIEKKLLAVLLENRLPLADITDELDKHWGISVGSSLTMVKHLIANKRILVNMNERLIHPCDIVNFSLSE